MLISPTEPVELRAIGTTTLLPEKFGADVAWAMKGGWVGVQRKEVKDFIASIGDGRIGQQVSQMQALQHAHLIIEGRVTWTTEGEMVNASGFGRPLTRAQWRGVVWSIQARGVHVGYTDSLADTILFIRQLEAWLKKERHTSLSKRDAVYAPWGKPGNRDFQRHVLMGFPGVGVELADRIIDKFGGIPISWSVTEQELLLVEGIGRKKAQMLLTALLPSKKGPQS